MTNEAINNPFLKPFKTPFAVPDFKNIRNEHYLPAIKYAIAEGKKEITKITSRSATFENTIEGLEASGSALERIVPTLFNLNSADTNESLQVIAQEASKMITVFDNEVKQNTKLFSLIKQVYEQDQSSMTTEQKMLLEKTYKSFVRKGAGLDDEKKEVLKEKMIALSSLCLTFDENVLKETNGFQMVLKKEDEIAGLPKDFLNRSKFEAKEKGLEGYLITLQAPSYIPFMEYSERRDLRQKLYRAYMSKSYKDNQSNNLSNIKKILTLRREIANLLGYASYAEYVLEERMAGAEDKVMDFLEDLLSRCKSFAKQEFEQVRSIQADLNPKEASLERWDWAYYAEKLRKRRYDFDDEILKPYFPLERVLNGVFDTAGILYDLKFVLNDDIPVYHKDVKGYEVWENGKLKAIFLADFFPRKGKRQGAWMTSFQNLKNWGGDPTIPIVSIVCNFTPSTPARPSLLKFDEVLTLFHEFGHALHGMLADTKYSSLSGTNVFWDFVELPSQIFENWCYEKVCLDLFARHCETSEKIPQALINKIRESSSFLEGYKTLRQLSFAFLDMAYHRLTKDEIDALDDLEAFEKQVMEKTDLFPPVVGTCMSTQFSHIFSGGYAAGYYSYKWAEVLDADAFSLFKEKGVFDKPTADSFKKNVLSKGGTCPPMELYKAFRGRAPQLEPLLKRAGFIQ